MFYKNTKRHKSLSEKNLVFSVFDDGVISNKDDSMIGANLCKSFYNLTFHDGALKTGLGFKIFEAPVSLEDLSVTQTYNFSRLGEITQILFDKWYDTRIDKFMYQLLLVDAQDDLWTIIFLDEDGNLVYPIARYLQSQPSFCCQYREDDKDCTLFFTNEGVVVMAYPGDRVLSNVPELISLVVHYDKLFGIRKIDHRLVYTSNLQLEDWSDSNNSVIEFLDNRGTFNKLVAFKDYVYLFRENGITRISLYANDSDFSFTHLYASSSKIYEDSVCVCGDRIFFFTRDGMYSFDGINTNKILGNYDVFFKNLDNNNCSSACLNGKYYLATKCNFLDEDEVGCEAVSHVNNVLFEIDINTLDVNILRGVDIRKMSAIDCPFMSKLCVCFYNENKTILGELTQSGKMFNSANKKSWTGFKTDLGFLDKRKKLKKLVIFSKYDCTLKIVSDEETKTYQISGENKEQELSINCYGKEFQFSFETDNQYCDIKKPMIVFDVEK